TRRSSDLVARNVDDIALTLEVIAGSDPHDSTASRREVPRYSEAVNDEKDRRYRIAYLREISAESVQTEIREAILQTLSSLKSEGHTVEEIDFPLMDYVLPTYYILATAEASSNLSRYDGVRYGYRNNAGDDLLTMYRKTRAEGFGKEVQRRILL